MSFFSDVYTMWLREMIRTVRAKSRVLSSLAMPFFWLVFIGVGLGSSFAPSSGTNYVTFLAPGIIGMVLLFNSMFQGMSVIYDRQFGFLKEVLVAPVSRTSILMGKALGGATSAMITATIMLVAAAAVGIIPLALGVVTAFIFMVLTSLCFVSLGLTVASKMRSMEGFQMIMSFLIMPIFLVSGALFPLENTPLWMQTISRINPLFYGVDGMRGSLISYSILPVWLNFAVIAGFTAAFILLGSYSFRKSTIQ